MKQLLLAPIFRLVFFVALGIIMADLFTPAVAWVAVPGVLGLVVLIWLDKRLLGFHYDWLAAGCIYLAALGLGAARLQAGRQDTGLPGIEYVNCTEARLAGQVISEVKANEWGRRAWVEVFAYEQDGQTVRAAGRVQLYLKPDQSTPIARFDTVYLQGDVRNLSVRSDSYRQYLERNGLFHAVYADQLVVRGAHRGLTYYALLTQAWFSDRLAALVPGEDPAAIAQAMFVGDTDGLRPEVREAFAVSGVSHILSISGQHIAIIFMFLQLLLKPLHLIRYGAQLKNILILIALLAYMLITGATPPVVRSVLMFGGVLVFNLFCQRYNLLNVLSAAALLQLVAEPEVVFNLSFQLSYGAVLGIITLLPVFERWVETPWKPVNIVFSWIGVTLSASIATLPFTLYYFGQFPTWFIISNLAVSLIAGLVVGCGFLTVLFCWVPGLSAVLGWATGWLLHVLYGMAGWFAALPESVVRSLESRAFGYLLIELALTLLLLSLPRLRHFRWTPSEAVQQTAAHA